MNLIDVYMVSLEERYSCLNFKRKVYFYACIYLMIMPERYVLVAPVGDNLDALYVGLREFPTRKIILVAPKDRLEEAKKLRESLEIFKIPLTIMELKGNMLESMFEALSSLKMSEGGDNIIVNVATGDRLSTCAALSASYVNSLRVFTVVEDRPMPLPMLRFSFNKLISAKKTDILRVLLKGSVGFDVLAKEVRVSLPLLSYHLNGDRETSGLIELGLVELSSQEKGKQASLSTLGKFFVKGYLQ